MKFLLTIVMSSSIAQTCLTPHTFEVSYKDTYDCLMDGYVKSINKMEQIGREEINEYGIYMKFDCIPFVLPEKKPVGQPILLRLYTN